MVFFALLSADIDTIALLFNNEPDIISRLIQYYLEFHATSPSSPNVKIDSHLFNRLILFVAFTERQFISKLNLPKSDVLPSANSQKIIASYLSKDLIARNHFNYNKIKMKNQQKIIAISDLEQYIYMLETLRNRVLLPLILGGSSAPGKLIGSRFSDIAGIQNEVCGALEHVQFICSNVHIFNTVHVESKSLQEFLVRAIKSTTIQQNFESRYACGAYYLWQVAYILEQVTDFVIKMVNMLWKEIPVEYTEGKVFTIVLKEDHIPSYVQPAQSENAAVVLLNFHAVNASSGPLSSSD